MLKMKLAPGSKKQVEDGIQKIWAPVMTGLAEALGQMIGHSVVETVNATPNPNDYDAGNLEWDQGYSQGHQRSSQGSIGVANAMRHDIFDSFLYFKLGGKFLFNFGNVNKLSELAPNWVYYEFGSGLRHDINRWTGTGIGVQGALRAAQKAYIPAKKIGDPYTVPRRRKRGGGFKMVKIGTIAGFEFVGESEFASRRNGEGLIVPLLKKRNTAWELGSHGVNVYGRSRALAATKLSPTILAKLGKYGLRAKVRKR